MLSRMCVSYEKSFLAAALPVVGSEGRLFTQPIIEERLMGILRHVQLERLNRRILQRPIPNRVARLEDMMRLLDDTRVTFRNGDNLARNARCLFALYNFYILQSSLCMSIWHV
jgi:hypothetical protein